MAYGVRSAWRVQAALPAQRQIHSSCGNFAEKEAVKEMLSSEANVMPDEKDLVSGPKKEYDPKIVELADGITQLNLLELADLCDILKDKMNIDEAETFFPVGAVGAGPAPAAAGAAEEEEEAAPKEEKTIFNVQLKSFDAKSKIKLIKEVRAATGLGLKEAKELVESAPCTVAKDMKKEDADALADKLKEVGGEIELD